MPTESLTPATDALCSNPTCQAPITDDNRVAGRRICRACWRAQKRKNAQDNRARLAEVDPKLKSRKKAAFLEELLRNGGFVERAIHAVGTSRQFINNEYNTDPDFAALWDAIRDVNNEALEHEVYRRAVTGVEKELVYQGKKTGQTVREYSDVLLMFYLKANLPNKYRDLPQKGNDLSDEELNTRLEAYLAKRTKKIGSGKATVEVLEANG